MGIVAIRRRYKGGDMSINPEVYQEFNTRCSRSRSGPGFAAYSTAQSRSGRGFAKRWIARTQLMSYLNASYVSLVKKTAARCGPPLP